MMKNYRSAFFPSSSTSIALFQVPTELWCCRISFTERERRGREKERERRREPSVIILSVQRQRFSSGDVAKLKATSAFRWFVLRYHILDATLTEMDFLFIYLFMFYTYSYEKWHKFNTFNKKKCVNRDFNKDTRRLKRIAQTETLKRLVCLLNWPCLHKSSVWRCLKKNKKKDDPVIQDGGRHTSSSLLTTPSSILPVIPEAGGVESLTIWRPLKAQWWGIRPNRPEMEINDGHLSLQDTGVFVIYLTKSSCDFGPKQWQKKGKCSTSLLRSPTCLALHHPFVHSERSECTGVQTASCE